MGQAWDESKRETNCYSVSVLPYHDSLEVLAKFIVRTFVLGALEDDVVGVDGFKGLAKRFQVVNSSFLSTLGMLYMKEIKHLKRLPRI